MNEDMNLTSLYMDTTVRAIGNDSLWLALMTAIAFILMVLYVNLWRRHRRAVRKVRFLFDAIDNGDYTFRFSDNERHGNDRLLNASLNRVKEILQHARDEQIEREKYFETILHAVDTGILVVDADHGLVLRCNRAALHLLHRESITHINQVKDLLQGYSLRESFTTLKGRRVRIIGFSDIRGELANQEIDSWVKLIRVLTHEIMNTVTPVISLSQALLKKPEEEQRQGLVVINQTARELIEFVENYRKFTHVPTPRPQLFYVKPFAERMAKLTGRTIEVKVEPSDLLVYADEGLVTRVITNLLKNACQATPPDKHITLHAYSNAEEEVVMEVGDDGPQIDAETASRIFVPFFTTKEEGSGIGLPISRQIMRVSGGSLELLPYADTGKYTVFRVTFR